MVRCLQLETNILTIVGTQITQGNHGVIRLFLVYDGIIVTYQNAKMH